MATQVIQPDIPGARANILSHYRDLGHAQAPRLVFVSGNFNILHPGHQRLLQFAAECGDLLVIGVNPDSVKGVMFPQNLRVEGIQQLSSVDYVIPIAGALEDILAELRPDVVVKGKEHENTENIEAPILRRLGGQLLFASGDTKFSSLDLLRNDFENIQYSSIVQPKDFLTRHKISKAQLAMAVHGLRGLKVVVIGDTIVDEYITCEALGLSQEDPTIVVNPIHRKKFIGGAAIVAAHASGLGGSVRFFSVVGNDSNALFAAENLQKFGVQHNLLRDLGRPTTLKQRFRTKEKTLLRVNELRQHSISAELVASMLEQITPAIVEADLLVFADFNYGCLPTKFVQTLTALGKKHNVTMVADSQSSSQIGDISRFKDMKLITPTEREARLGVSDFESGLIVLTDRLMKKASAEFVFITMGGEGLLVRAPGKKGRTRELQTDRLPAFNMAPKDSAGAGDSLLITASMLMANDVDVWTAAYLGSLAAGIQVSRVGNTPLTSEEVLSELRVEQVRRGAVS